MNPATPDNNPQIDTVVHAIRDRGLEVPARFFLETIEPFAGVLRVFAEGYAPMVRMFFGSNTGRLTALLEDRDAVRNIIAKL
jgi:hypothetical protein